uniref:Uncharacterized protein n=1 Tax=Chromera velia CCMP2878 TaxID=1169474 RepID=A0A0G4H8H5_9ALVE|eukprot:Cvel_25149.t1-p1 / transcript=Cvel_25149.t1 / gene=Cvel_25149 / organism=Chromera_velia_CCMP2878 / gene_product=Protein NLRC5, putative / transcript_product=Protein NLRC5, putative / location=Cvel_scaffold2812:7486-13268(+) / protein_length=952 / sequence_SO=supercontig / SO=protein_coding / is_pseudo=false
MLRSPEEAGGSNRGATQTQSEVARPNELTLTALASVLAHTSPTEELISLLASEKESYGVAWLLLHFMKSKRITQFPLLNLDLSVYSLGPRKLRLFLASLPGGFEATESLTCGPAVCKEPVLSALVLALQRLKGLEAQKEGASGLKTLCLAKTMLKEHPANALLHSTPSSLENVDLSANCLRTSSLETLGYLISSKWLPSIISLDLSKNLLGPPGVSALSKGLASGPSLPLETLRLCGAQAKTEGIQALSEALKAKKTTRLRTLDLGHNYIWPVGLQHFADAAGEGALPELRVLILKQNALTLTNGTNPTETDYAPLTQLLASTDWPNLEELDLRICCVSSEGGQVCSQGIAGGKFPKLRILNLCHARVRGNGIVALGNALAEGKSPALQVLDTRADIFGEGFASLSQSLAKGKCPQIKILEINASTAHPGASVDEGVENLAGALRESQLPLLERLVLRAGLGLTEPAGGGPQAALGRGLGAGGLSCLQALVLVSKTQDEQGMWGLAEGLKAEGLPALRELQLTMFYHGGGGGSRALGRAVGSGNLPSLRLVSLTWMANQGFASLCDGILTPGAPRRLSERRVEVSIDLKGSTVEIPDQERDVALFGLAACIRSGAVPKLMSLMLAQDPRGLRVGPQAARAFGKSLTHPEAKLDSLRTLILTDGLFRGNTIEEQERGLTALLEGMAGGSGSLIAPLSLDIERHAHFASGVLGPVSAPQLAEVFKRGKVAGLSTLKADTSRVGSLGMQAICLALSCPNVTQIKRLHFSPIIDAPAAAAAPQTGVVQQAMLSMALGSGQMNGLEELYIAGPLLSEGTRLLLSALSSGAFRALRSLELIAIAQDEQNRVKLPGMLTEFVIAEKLPALTQLKITASRMNDEGVTTLTQGWTARPPPPLEQLKLTSTQITNEGAQTLVSFISSGRMPSLERLDLRMNQVDVANHQALSASLPLVTSFF